MIVVVTGTHEQPFTRLVTAADAYAADNPGERVFVQYGSATPPVHAEGSSVVGRALLDELLREADVVVAHGGPGTLIEAMEAGHMPVACPRDPARSEHVDDHQLRFVAHLVASRMVVPLLDVAEFASVVGSVRRGSTRAFDREPVLENRLALARLLDGWLVGGGKGT